MAWTLQEAKVRYGIDPSDTSKDALLTRMMESAIEVAESYCNRFFLFKDPEEEIFDRFQYKTIQLHRLPISSITELKIGESACAADSYFFEAKTGRIILSSYMSALKTTVKYSGGFRPDNLPFNLEYALYLILDYFYNASQTGLAGSGDVGDISSITVPDVGTIRFNENASSTASGGPSAFYESYNLLDQFVIPYA